MMGANHLCYHAHMADLLLIEGDPGHSETLARILENAGFRVTRHVANAASADYRLADIDAILGGPEVFDDDANLLRLSIRPLIVLDWNASIHQAVRAMKLGASDYLAAPVATETLITSVNNALATPSTLHLPANDRDATPPIIGSSKVMRELRERILRVAPTDATVLLQGELGTGKAMLAKALHNASRRSRAPLITVNCAAIPESLIEQELFGRNDSGEATAGGGLLQAADGGTLYLLEVGALPLPAQARLLQFLATQNVNPSTSPTISGMNVRVVASSQLDLKTLTDQGRFRDDLYYRLDVVSLHTPPLRDRGGDVLELANHTLLRTSEVSGSPRPKLSAKALDAIATYHWPGNIRELENVLERAAILCAGSTIDHTLLAIDTQAPEPSETSKTGSEEISLEQYFLRFVREHEDHLTETELAEKLGISRKSLWERRQRFGIPRRKTRKRGPRRAH